MPMGLPNKTIKEESFPAKNENIWYLDCGATEHMTPYIKKLKHFKKTSLRVHMANREKIQAEGKGDVTLQLSDKNGGSLADFADVLFVPNLGTNLLSIGRLVEKGLKITFENDEATISNQSGDVLLTAFSRNRLYEIEEQTQIIKLADGQLSVWHRRFGNIDCESSIPISVKNNLQNIDKKDEELCSTCTLDEMKMNPFRYSLRVSTTKPLELIHSDLLGPIEPTSQGGSRYFVSFIDDYSRYTMVFPIKSNNEVLLKFDEYRRFSENAIGRKIKTIKTGRGIQYISFDFEDYLANNDINQQYKVSGESHENSIAKNVNHKLMNMTKCMIKESGIPDRLWADALVTACYVLNKCPSVAIHGQVPEELWTGKRVNTEHLRVFGCRAWITLNSETTFENLFFNLLECIFIGYSDTIHSYKLWERQRNIFFITNDVNFDENVFPCKAESVCGNKILDPSAKLHIGTLHDENEANKRPRKASNASNIKIIVQTEESDVIMDESLLPKQLNYEKETVHLTTFQSDSNYENNLVSEKRPPKEDDVIFATVNNILKSQNKMKSPKKTFLFRAKRKVFPLSSSKQKLIRNFRKRV